MSGFPIRPLAGVALGVGFYLMLFGWTAVRNRGTKLVESGCLAAGFFMLFACSSRVPKFPICSLLVLQSLSFCV